MDIKQQAEQNEAKAKAELAAMRQTHDPEELYQLLKRYIRLRYLLDDDPFWDDDLESYAKYSIRKTMEKSGDPAKLRDLGINCAGTSSSTTKHILLIISLRKGLGIALDPDDAMTAHSARDLAALLSRALLNA